MTRKQKKLLVRIISGAALTCVILFIPVEGALKLICCLVPYFVLGYDILIKAFKGIISRQVFDESFLMAVATVGALVLGEYLEAVAVMLFFQIGELFESYAVGKSRKNIAALMDIRPDCANIEIDDELTEVPAEDVEVGTEIIIRPGERVPLDGIVVSGESSIDTRALTGESVPGSIKAGDSIFSGSVNIGAVIKVRTTKGFCDSTAGKILELIENASAKKSKSENFITRFARVYTPAVCVSALCLAVLVPLIRLTVLGSAPMWGEWLMRALNFLVISCPCALVISIPLSFFGGIGKASSMGILIKGSNYMETLSKMKYVLFDKTGTLTKGSFEVVKIVSETLGEKELLFYASAAEFYSTHPIAESIRRAHCEAVEAKEITQVKEISGKGVTATVCGKEVAVGNDKLMGDLGIKANLCENYGTVAYVVIDGRYEGYIVISDTIKETSAKTVSELKKQGMTAVMLTGDRESSAKHVASELGITQVKSELLPQDKVKAVEEYIAKAQAGEKVAFAGDGINDAPVLTRADIGIAMGALGSDAAIEAADIVLMDDDPYKIVTAKCIAKKTLRIVKQNTVFAIGIKLVFLLLGAIGLSNLWLAIFADVGVMVIAVLNAMRCMKK